MTSLVTPSNIPWQSLKQVDLEECLFWLLDSMGGKDIDWRKGGKGDGGTDGGRDIEATFYVTTPDGELQPERWWLESKGRSKTVEPSAVKDAVVNVESRRDVDVIVIATNTQFSNPTRDWVKEWQRNHPRPRVRLWDRDSLERMVIQHPSVVVRLFPDALSEQGRVEAIRSRFWNHSYLASAIELHELWTCRQSLLFSSESAIALAASEIANGSVSIRPWMMVIDDETLRDTLVHGLGNVSYLLYRAQRLGINGSPIIGALAYALMVALCRIPFEDFWPLLDADWIGGEGERVPTELKGYAIDVIVKRIAEELSGVCAVGCQRVITDCRHIDEREIPRYWKRFSTGSDEDYTKAIDMDNTILTIVRPKERCAAGLELSDESKCPWQDFDRDKEVDRETLETFRVVLINRVKVNMSNP